MINSRALIFIFLIAAFAAGYFLQASRSANKARTILYYVDPMHPSYRSDKPGTAPDCGMQLEPVYEDNRGTEGDAGEKQQAAPGAVRISIERQQLIGVQTGIVEKKQTSRKFRMLGRVAVDETRMFRVNATIDGWITRTSHFATGSRVRRNDVLAGFYSPDFLSAQQAYLYALSSQDRILSQGTENPARKAQVDQFTINIRQYRDALMNLGMGTAQIEEISRTRQYAENIDIASPADGVILERNVSQGQRFEKGTELYRIADLRHVWILADVFENEAHFMAPGIIARVRLTNENLSFPARVSDAIPQFDPDSRTLKLRLEADNQELLLKPDVFVEVEMPVQLPASIVVPADAVIDSGVKKTVFVDHGNGWFEPRAVETGWRVNELVEITAGLTAGERIVLSGNFLIDSESRMKSAAFSGASNETDPVCGALVSTAKARAGGMTRESQGRTWYFCCRDCKETFEKERLKPPTPPGKIQSVSVTARPGEHHD